MSFEPGRKLGLAASMINVIVPVVTVILYVFFFLSLFGVVSSAVNGGSHTASSLLPSGITAAVIALGVIGLARVILFLIAMHRLSQYYNEPGIFKNALYGFLINIIGVAAAVVFAFALVFTTLVSSTASSTPHISAAGVLLGVAGLILAGFVIEIVSAVLYYRAFNKLGEKSGVNSFNTAGIMYLIGTVLTIVLVGSLIVWIAWIFAAIGFNSLKPKANETTILSYPVPQTATTNLTQKRFCPYCGTENPPDSVYCVICGQKLA